MLLFLWSIALLILFGKFSFNSFLDSITFIYRRGFFFSARLLRTTVILMTLRLPTIVRLISLLFGTLLLLRIGLLRLFLFFLLSLFFLRSALTLSVLFVVMSVSIPLASVLLYRRSFTSAR